MRAFCGNRVNPGIWPGLRPGTRVREYAGVVRVSLLRCGARHRPGIDQVRDQRLPTVYWVVRRPPAAGRVAEDSFLSPKLVDHVLDEITSEHRARHSGAHGLSAGGTGLPIASRG